MKNTRNAKHISIVSVKLVKEKKIHRYLEPITQAKYAASIMRELIGDKDRENLIVIGVDIKGNITHINYGYPPVHKTDYNDDTAIDDIFRD